MERKDVGRNLRFQKDFFVLIFFSNLNQLLPNKLKMGGFISSMSGIAMATGPPLAYADQ